MTSEATFLTISAGDWLQALATIVALVGTVLVTLWIERRRAGQHERDAKARIGRALRTLSEAIKSVRDLPEVPVYTADDPYQNPVESDRDQSMRDISSLLYACRQAIYVIDRAVVEDPELWLAIEDVRRALSTSIPEFETARETVWNNGIFEGGHLLLGQYQAATWAVEIDRSLGFALNLTK